MKSLLYYLVQVIVASGILYGYYHLALRNKKFHRYNRFYLLAAFVISISVPFLNIPVYFTDTSPGSSFILHTLTSISTSGTGVIVNPVNNIPVVKTHWLTWQNFTYILYSIIAAIALIRILFSLKKIRNIIRNNQVEKLGNIHFVNTDEPGTPFSFFRWLFWNRKIELRSEKGEQIFKHELFHIQQKHSRDIIFMEMIMIVFWINPFFHLIKREVKAIHEFLADKFAAKENQHWEYAELLLMQVLGSRQHLVNPFFHNQIKRRIAMITSSKKPGFIYLRKLMALPIAAIVVMLFAFAYKTKNDIISLRNLENEHIISDKVSQFVREGDVISKNRNSIKNNIHFISKGIAFKNNKKMAIFYDTLPSKTQMPNVDDIKDTLLRGFLFFVDGKEVPYIKSFRDGLYKIFPFQIDSVILLGKQSAIEKYGKSGEKGIIEMITKEKNGKQPFLFNPIDTTWPEKLDNKVFDRVEVEPNFPGGPEKWKQYLEKNTHSLIIADKGAPEGKYTVVVQFIVDTNGHIHNLKVLTKHGYGMEQEAIRLILNVPIWIPAIQNGQKVNAYRKQLITFIIAEDDKPSHLNEVVATGISSSKGRYTNLPEDTIVPSFAGGEIEWRRHLERNLNAQIPANKGAPAGTYTTVTQFLVKADGTTSEFKSLTNHGYGMEEEALRVIQSAKQWDPAIVNGKKVNIYKIQPITFIIKDDLDGIPKVSKSELQNFNIHKLLELEETTQILSFNFTIDLPDGHILEINNSGNQFSPTIKKQLSNATAGNIFTLDNVKIMKEGKETQEKSRIYKITN